MPGEIVLSLTAHRRMRGWKLKFWRHTRAPVKLAARNDCKVTQALFRSVSSRRPAKGLILHADRGGQYCSHVGGALGVAHVIRLLRDELEMTMALTGCAQLSDIGHHCIIAR